MANRVNRGSFGRGRGVRRAVDWSASFTATTFTSIAGATKVLLVSFSAAALASITPGTIVRTRGLMSVASDQGAASEFQIGAMGIGLFNDVARALGPTGLPGPSTNANDDRWFVHQFFGNSFFRSASGLDGQFATQYVIDSKAMRKIDDSDGLCLMIENAGAFGIDVTVQVRFLIKAG